MNKRWHHKGKLSLVPTCDNCIHTFRKKGGQDIVVCVPHLKDMPANHSLVCELYSMKSRILGAG